MVEGEGVGGVSFFLNRLNNPPCWDDDVVASAIVGDSPPVSSGGFLLVVVVVSNGDGLATPPLIGVLTADPDPGLATPTLGVGILDLAFV